MKIMTLEEFRELPKGTLFVEIYKNVSTDHGKEFNPDQLDISEIYMKVENDERQKFWHAVFDLKPECGQIDDKNAVCNWFAWDNATSEFTDDDLFGVLEDNEIMQMIKLLTAGLSTNLGSWAPDCEKWFAYNRVLKVRDFDILRNLHGSDEDFVKAIRELVTENGPEIFKKEDED